MSDRHSLELWGGIEATRNRVGDAFFDQLEVSGHAERIDDLDRIAELGIRTLRYPILWEHVAPDGIDRADWSWADARLQRLRELGIRPVVTLVHHGSGPRGVDLLDPKFATGLAEFAGALAERHPWLEDFTPVNEPLTTARFSTLYGVWHPHLRDMRAMISALLVQTRATIDAMTAIRTVIPHARLVQTEDIGKVFSTPELAYQAEFENDRRWLSLDLLCGAVRPDHPLWHFLAWAGIDAEQLAPFANRPCPPDLIGVNYYVTGERFLDERLDRYPPWTHGGNDRIAYADVEAVRVRAEGITGIHGVLRETWDRYRIPIAVTEAHLGSSADEQIRWLEEIWRGALAARVEGVDVRAVTVWSLLGAFDWNSLVTCRNGHYEPGAFDVRGGQPAPTEIADWIHARAHGILLDHPALASPGWWRLPSRLLYPTDVPADETEALVPVGCR